MRPGVVRFALAYDQWTTGVSDIVIYAFTVKDEKQRSNGVHANAVMWTDPSIANICMLDPSGGSVSFYDCPYILLADQQSCTCHLVAATRTRQTNVSMHLREIGLVDSEKVGRKHYCRARSDALEQIGGRLTARGRASEAAPGDARLACP
jgi:DNA-binding transcriptional ArsR family regulator